MIREIIITKENAGVEELELMKCFNFNELHYSYHKDTGGRYVRIKELETDIWNCSNKEFLEELRRIVKQYKFATSKKALDMLKISVDRDNEHADYLNFRQYDIVEVKKLEDDWYGVIIKFRDNGQLHNFIETGLSYALKEENKLAEYVNRKRRYFTAGGLEDKDVDFIFNGVGHSTTKHMYTFDNAECVERTCINKVLKLN